MKRVFRLVIMWVLVAALPVQSVAVATMIACGPGHHVGASEVAGQFHEHGHEIGSSHAHWDEQSVQDGAEDEQFSNGKPGLAKALAHKCSACASCCVGTALPSEPFTVDSVDLTEFFAPLAPSSVAAFLSESLERPPRLFLA